MKKIHHPLSLLTGLLAVLASCSSTSPSTRPAGPLAAAPATPSVERLEGRRTPYGWGYRVGEVYAYRPWTW